MTADLPGRRLSWSGYRNVRDLGGLPTALSATGTTAFGRVVRGPRRELLDEAGWRGARAHGVTSVVDLRNDDEPAGRDGDPTVSPEATAGLVVVRAPTEDQSDPELARLCLPILDSPEYWPHHLRLQPRLVADALRAEATAPPGVVLVHCSAGRDRTGLVCTLLLAHAGVAPGTVADDYEISVREMAATPAHSPVSDRQVAFTSSELDEFVGAARPRVVALAEAADVLLPRLGLDEQELAALRARLLP